MCFFNIVQNAFELHNLVIGTSLMEVISHKSFAQGRYCWLVRWAGISKSDKRSSWGMGGPHIKLRAHVCMFCAHVFLACGASPNPSSSRSAFQPSEQRRLFQVLDCSQNVHLVRIINAYETIPVIIFGKSALSSLRVWITYPLRSHDWASNEYKCLRKDCDCRPLPIYIRAYLTFRKLPHCRASWQRQR